MQGIPEGAFAFDRFRVDPAQRALWIDGKPAKLGARAFDVLVALAERRDRIVGKDELLQLVWPTTVVEENALQVHISTLRRLFGAATISTVPGRGYRFTAPLAGGAVLGAGAGDEAAAAQATAIVGRDTELAKLLGAFANALAGQRQIVFVTGEAGIGKSALVDTFIGALVAARPGLKLAQGQCIEHYGAGEPYLPLLDAIGRLARQGDDSALAALLRRCAPTVLLQLSSLIEDADIAALRLKVAGGSGERMLREMVEAIEAAAADEPLVLVLEDLHWSDGPTVQALTLLARRREPARLLVVAVSRLVELVLSEHPLKAAKHELIAHGAASELALGYLSADAVRAFVSQRLPAEGGAADAIFRRSQGHPLFMRHLTDDAGRGAATELPGGVREVIDAQLAHLTPLQQHALEAASVSGAEFAAASVAAALGDDLDTLEGVLETLAASEQFVEARGLAQWSDGTVSGRYAFRHDLYRETLYRRLGAARRAQWHGRIGERLALAHGSRAGEIAAELAMHFEHAKDARRAARYCREAAETALHRFAYNEALAHVDKGLALLEALDVQEADAERDRTELLLRLTQGAALMPTKGFGAAEVEETYARAQALCVRLDNVELMAPVLAGLWTAHVARAALVPARQTAEQLLALAQRRQDAAMAMVAHNAVGQVLRYTGELKAALAHMESTLALYDARQHARLAVDYGEDPGVIAMLVAAHVHWLLGRADSAGRELERALALARTLDHPFSEVQVLWIDGLFCLEIGDFGRLEATARRLGLLCTDNDFKLHAASARILQATVLAKRGELASALELGDRGLREWRSLCILFVPCQLAAIARIYSMADRAADALRLVDEALATVGRSGERWYEAELGRLRGELLLLPPSAARHAQLEAEACFERAIELARQQQAKALELRASISLARLWQRQRKAASARSMLSEIYCGFSEGSGTRDLVEAASLLESLQRS